MTDAPKKPPHDVLGKLITQLEQQLTRQGGRRARRGAVRSSSASTAAQPKARSSLDAYLAERIERALIPLRALLHENDVSFIGTLLRERLATDPNLSKLVHRLTGGTTASRSSR